MSVRNRSVPADAILAHLAYRDVAKASIWLGNVFGFREHYRYGDDTGAVGVRMRAGHAWVMLQSARPGRSAPVTLGTASQSLTIFIDDLKAHYRRAQAAGPEIVEDRHETIYGDEQYGAVDLDGHHWLFARHVRDVNPEDWGAILATPNPVDA